MQPHIYMWIYVHMYVHIYMWNEPTGPEILPWAKNCGTCSSSTSTSLWEWIHSRTHMWSKSTGAESLSWARRVLVRFPNPPLAVGELGTEESWQLLELHPPDSSMESNTCHFYLLHWSSDFKDNSSRCHPQVSSLFEGTCLLVYLLYMLDLLIHVPVLQTGMAIC